MCVRVHAPNIGSIRSAVQCRRGVALIEALLATLILGMVVLAVSSATLAGAQHHAFADESYLAHRVAVSMLEEIVSRPYEPQPATNRPNWGVPDFDGLDEAAGALRDASLNLLPVECQHLERRVRVDNHALDMGTLGVDPVPGRLVTVTVRTSRGHEYTLERFIAAPSSEILP